jgi:biotin operon repressor
MARRNVVADDYQAREYVWHDDHFVPADQAPRSRSRKKAGRDFVIVPRAWVERLRRAKHIGTWSLAIDLLARSWRAKNYENLPVSNIIAAKAGVSRTSKWRALRELEALGLIVVQSRQRRVPTVKVLLEPPNMLQSG